ncbi:hypothetical protein IWX79_004332 [Janthinobacterium sp. CAN_S1]|uniref:H-NS histone family protein n=1 Tax=Janthinobacterium sp. CAN_S1 TaxID=2787725 RepID=UPI0018CA321D
MNAIFSSIAVPSYIANLFAEFQAAETAHKQAKERLNTSRHIVIAQVHTLIAVFDITADESYPAEIKKKSVVDKDYSPDYFFRDMKTDEEWDGKGKKRPAFLAGKKKLDDYKIYHATGTKTPPVANVKPAAAQNEVANSSEVVNSSIISTVENTDAQAVVVGAPVVAIVETPPTDATSPATIAEPVAFAAQQIPATASLPSPAS